MKEKTQRDRWMRSMVKKHGSEEAVREFMRQSASKSSRNANGTPYFARLKQEDPELLKDIARKAGQRGTRKVQTKAGDNES